MASDEQEDFVRLPLENDRSRMEDSDRLMLSEGDPIPANSTLRTVMTAPNVKFTIQQVNNINNVIRVAHNPTEIEEVIPMDWVRFGPPGGSFASLHFVSTRNYAVDMELYWTAYTAAEAKASEEARSLLLSWNYPEFNEQGWSVGPPRLYAFWPNVIDMSCHLVDLRMRDLRFARDGRVTRWVATMRLEECLETNVLAPDGMKIAPRPNKVRTP